MARVHRADARSTTMTNGVRRDLDGAAGPPSRPRALRGAGGCHPLAPGGTRLRARPLRRGSRVARRFHRLRQVPHAPPWGSVAPSARLGTPSSPSSFAQGCARPSACAAAVAFLVFRPSPRPSLRGKGAETPDVPASRPSTRPRKKKSTQLSLSAFSLQDGTRSVSRGKTVGMV